MVRERSGYFARWADARKRLAWIQARWSEGRTVYLVTYTRALKLTAKHAEIVKATPSGLLVRQGSRWIDYSGTALRAD